MLVRDLKYHIEFSLFPSPSSAVLTHLLLLHQSAASIKVYPQQDSIFPSALHPVCMLGAVVRKNIHDHLSSDSYDTHDSNNCHLLSGSALPNHSKCVSMNKRLWCNILLHRQRDCLYTEARNRWCNGMQSAYELILLHAKEICRILPSVVLGRRNTLAFVIRSKTPCYVMLLAMQLSIFSGGSIQCRAGVWCSTQHLSALPQPSAMLNKSCCFLLSGCRTLHLLG